MKKKRYSDDDGRTIADMSGIVRPSTFGRIPKRGGEKNEEQPETGEEKQEPQLPQLTKKEQRLVMLYTLRAALIIALVFIGALALFLLFCQFVWFR